MATLPNGRRIFLLARLCQVIADQFIELMAQLPQYEVRICLRPDNPVAVKRDGDEYLQWLDKQPATSLVYLSFGSTTSISDEQVEQLDIGLQ